MDDGILEIQYSDNGQFSLRRVRDGAWLLFPGQTSHLSLMVAGNVYSHITENLHVLSRPQEMGENNLRISYRSPEGMLLDQILTLRNGTVEIKFIAKNETLGPLSTKIRVLLDTQIDENDGSPLYAPGTGLKIMEQNFSPGLSSWKSYDAWPDYRVQSVCTYMTSTEAVLFAFWPSAEEHAWYYRADPSQRFYTPGKYRSDDGSDSCVLSYFNLGIIRAGEQSEVIFYYGEETPTSMPGKGGLKIALLNLQKVFNQKIQSDLHLLAKYHARSFKGIYGANDEIQNLFTRDGAKREIVGTIMETLRIMAAQVAGSPTEVGTSMLSAPIVIGAKAWVSGLDRKIAIEYLGELFYKYYKNGCDPEMEDIVLNERIYKILSNDGEIGITDWLNTINSEFKNVIEMSDKLPASIDVKGLITCIDRLGYDMERSRFQEITAKWPSDKLRTLTFDKLGLISTFDQLSRMAAGYEEAQEPIRWVGYSAGIGLGVAKVLVGIISHGVSLAAELITAVGAGLTVKAVTDIKVSELDLITDAYSGLVGVLSLRCFAESEIPKAENSILETLAVARQVVNDPNYGFFDSGIEIKEIVVNDAIVNRDNANDLMNVSGKITILNPNIHTSRINAFVEVLGPKKLNQQAISLRYNEPFSMNGNSEKSIDFTIEVPSMHHWRTCGQYLVKAWVSADYGDIVLGLAEFAVGPRDAVIALTQSERQRLLEGVLKEGEVEEANYTIAENSSGALFSLIYEGSDIDLHLFDTNDNHVGMNYSTGQVEMDIPGVTYSGPNVDNEWISIEGHRGEMVRIVVLGVDIPQEDENYIVSVSESPELMPALIAASASIPSQHRNDKNRLSSTLLLEEWGGMNSLEDISVRIENVTKEYNPKDIRIYMPDRMISPGSFIRGTISLPKQKNRGILNLKVEGRDSGLGLMRQTDLTIQIPASQVVIPLVFIIVLLIIVIAGIVTIIIMLKSLQGKKPPRVAKRGSVFGSLIIGDRVVKLTKTVTSLGRSSYNDIVLQSDYISRAHAQIIKNKDVYIIRDLDSTSGIKLNKRLVSQAHLADGDILEIGDFPIRVSLKTPGPVKKPQQKRAHGFLLINDREVPITKKNTILGRSSECDIILQSEYVSRKHAVIIRDPHGLSIRELGSTIGIRVNGQNVIQARLYGGEIVEIADFKIHVKIR